MEKLLLFLLLSVTTSPFQKKVTNQQAACTHKAATTKAAPIFVPLDILKMR